MCTDIDRPRKFLLFLLVDFYIYYTIYTPFVQPCFSNPLPDVRPNQLAVQTPIPQGDCRSLTLVSSIAAETSSQGMRHVSGTSKIIFGILLKINEWPFFIRLFWYFCVGENNMIIYLITVLMWIYILYNIFIVYIYI